MARSSFTHAVLSSFSGSLRGHGDRCRGRLFSKARRSVLGALVLVACSPDGGGPETQPSFVRVNKSLDAALLSVWGRAADDVWVVGADVGSGPVVRHYDGASWEAIDTGQQGDLWWVSGDDDAVYFCGEGGLMLRYDVARGQVERMEVPTKAVLYGVWAVGDGTVYAVGGDALKRTGVVLRYDGTQWTEVVVPSDVGDGLTYFKVWGTSASEVFIVGAGGRILRYDGTTFQDFAVPGAKRLVTVHGAGDRVIAVGGIESAFITEFDRSRGVFEDATPGGVALQQNGVFVWGDEALSVGNQGTVWSRGPKGWSEVPDLPRVPQDYHAVYVDPDGGAWVVGGFVVAPPRRGGVLLHRGAPIEEIPS